MFFYVETLFQSTPSVKRATIACEESQRECAISIHTLCEEGDDNAYKARYAPDVISIHTLCEEGDFYLVYDKKTIEISIHTLCEEGDDFYPIG